MLMKEKLMLRRALAMSVSMLALTALAVPASAGLTKGWYLSLEGGANLASDTTFGITPPGGNFAGEFDTGWAVMGAVGYRWDSNWRLEFELAFRKNDWDVALPLNSGDMSQFSQMINLAYDIRLNDNLALSLGAGIGGSFVSFNLDNSPLVFDDDYVMAGQLIAQLTYKVSKQVELFVDYRYFMTDDPSHSFVAGGPRELAYDNDTHTVMIGLRYDLSPDQEPVIVQAQPFVPPPPPEPVVAKQYIVFFGWNKFNLTRQAQETVAQAAATAKQIGSASILVVGHTDTSGSSRYNQKLSERRANTVANELVRNGIDQAAISAMGKGENELLVQTGDSMREPQNRRVEMSL
jgi:outer membrane protein OmpA-like peptidoglycan-associated protein